VFSPINNLSKDKDSFKKVLVKTTKKEALNLSSDIHVMGGKSVYEAFNGVYDKIVVNNFNIPEEIINEIELQSDIVFNRVRLDNE
jgi:dihydrofolate reductase